MRKKIIYTIGILILVFVGWSLYTASISFKTEKSSMQLMAEDAMFRKISGGFYIIDAITEQPIPHANVIIKLSDDEDTKGSTVQTVFTKVADEHGWMSFSNLNPNISITQATDKVKSNHYLIIADNGSGMPKKVGGCIMNLSEPGHYDSWSIKIQENNKLDNLKTCSY